MSTARCRVLSQTSLAKIDSKKMKAITLVVNENQNGNVQTMTSLEIAELTGKQHNHVMRDIRNMESAWEKVTQSKFGLSTYKDSTGRTLPCYSLTKTECFYIATKFNDEARAKLVLRWEQLEMEEGFATPHSALQRSMKRKSAQLLKSTIERFSCWGTRTRTRKGRTRICSVTITPYPNFG